MVPPFLHGRGIFQYSYGIIPFRRPVVSVVGRPIEVPKISEPTVEEVRKWQGVYVEELRRIYEEGKDKYLPDRVRELVFVE